MMYGPPPPDYPQYPRATSSPPIIVLVSGLAALLGFLLGVSVGFGAGSTSPSSGDEPAPRVTVTVESSPSAPVESSAPVQPVPTDPAQPVPTGPAQTVPTGPAQTTPAQTPPAQTPPAQSVPSQTQPGGGTRTNPMSLRTLHVGTDIQPGTYRTTGPAAGFTMCYWARLRSASGDVIAAGMPTGAATVTVQPTDKAFQTGGCAEWTKS
ncbi:hypothetical protein ABZW11_25290 [Nonomuraea sp. NPDC004580]|uniref:hypothetical protein n=1 Tax=Nonomuraea sp. NPDC004580 TaxID=3154552 RepID=UPI0033B5087B